MSEVGWKQIGPVEIHVTDGTVSLRSVADKVGDELVLDKLEWAEFVRLAKEGDLDQI